MEAFDAKSLTNGDVVPNSTNIIPYWKNAAKTAKVPKLSIPTLDDAYGIKKIGSSKFAAATPYIEITSLTNENEIFFL